MAKTNETKAASKKATAVTPRIGKTELTKVKFVKDDPKGRWKEGQTKEFGKGTAASLIELGDAEYVSGAPIKQPEQKDEE